MAEMEGDMNVAFSAYDSNKDGTITAREHKNTGDVRRGSAFAGFTYRHFAELDTNGDGNVDRKEMLTTTKFIFNTADSDRDGKVTKAEWQTSPNASAGRAPKR